MPNHQRYYNKLLESKHQLKKEVVRIKSNHLFCENETKPTHQETKKPSHPFQNRGAGGRN
jgi:hypothetical protein